MTPQLAGWLARHAPSCHEAARLLSESMDRPLPLGQSIRLRLHTFICHLCKQYQLQLRFLRQALRRHAARALECEGALPSEARQRILRALAGAAPST